MSLLRSEKDYFDAEVLYVFAEDEEISVVNKEIDVEFIKKTAEEKEEVEESDRLGTASDVPFNQTIDLTSFTEEDVKKAVFTFRRPSLDDMPLLLSSFMSVDASGNVAPGDVFEFSNRKLKLLFVKGTAQDQDGKELKITPANLGKIPPVLGSAMSLKMTDTLNM